MGMIEEKDKRGKDVKEGLKCLFFCVYCFVFGCRFKLLYYFKYYKNLLCWFK